MRLRSFLSVLFLVAGAPLCAAQSTETRIACVDVEAVVARSRLGAEVSARVRDFVATRNLALQNAEKLLNEESQALAQKRGVLSAMEFAGQRDALQARALELEQRREQVRAEITEFNRAQLERVTAVLAPIVDAIGAERGYTVILNVDVAQPVTVRRSSVIYLGPRVDITADVIARLDAATTPARK